MGWTNLVPIFHDDVTHILQPEIPDTMVPYIDNVPIHGPETHYIDTLTCHCTRGKRHDQKSSGKVDMACFSLLVLKSTLLLKKVKKSTA